MRAITGVDVRAFLFLTEDIGPLRIAEDVRVVDLESPYVREHIGLIVVRGLWYPFVRVGT